MMSVFVILSLNLWIFQYLACSQTFLTHPQWCHQKVTWLRWRAICQFCNDWVQNIFADHRDDEPQITEELFFSSVYVRSGFNVKVIVTELTKCGLIQDESSLRIMSSLRVSTDTMKKLHYVMYRLGKKENGLQIFYRCLRETQDICPPHRRVANRMETKG